MIRDLKEKKLGLKQRMMNYFLLRSHLPISLWFNGRFVCSKLKHFGIESSSDLRQKLFLFIVPQVVSGYGTDGKAVVSNSRGPRFEYGHKHFCKVHLSIVFFKMGRSRPLFVYFRPFLITISIIQIDKAQMVCLGFEPAAEEWQAQMIPRSYGGRHTFVNC